MAHKILGGWSLDGVFIYQSGAPFSIGTGADYAGVGPGGGTQYWVVNGPLRVTDQYSQGGAAADPNFYSSPQLRPARLNSLLRPPEPSTHSASATCSTGPARGIPTRRFSRKFRVTERHRFQFRWEQYDTLNHPNWSSPNTTPTSAAFGKIATKSNNRDQQLALKYFF